MTSPEELAQKREEFRARHRERYRRRQPKIFAAVAVFWGALAVLWWLNPQGDAVVRWSYTVLAVLQAGVAFLSWRRLGRRERENDEAPGR